MASLELLVFHRRALRKIVDGTSACIMPLISAPFVDALAQQRIFGAIEVLFNSEAWSNFGQQQEHFAH
jgi:hypothetical protein